MSRLDSEILFAVGCGLAASVVLGGLIIIGSRNLDHFDAALVAYTSATLFAVFAIAYRYAMWLQRPPTALYWRRGWQVFIRRDRISGNIAELFRRFCSGFLANAFIWRRDRLRWAGHWLIMWGWIIASAITFPMVFGWIHFANPPGDFTHYRVFVFGFGLFTFPIESAVGFFIFHGLVWSAILVIAGVMIALRRRMREHGAAALQTFGDDFLPLILLFLVSVTGLMMTASYSWMHGYAYDFLAILHALAVIFTLLYLPFGKFFHIFQRPAQLGVAFYKDAGREDQARCVRCGDAYASRIHIADLIQVEQALGYDYRLTSASPAEHYQQVCPRCRRSLVALAQGALWAEMSPHAPPVQSAATRAPALSPSNSATPR